MNNVNTFEIGTPALDPYGAAGFVSAVTPASGGTFVLSGGMAPVQNDYEICFESGRISTLPDSIAAPYFERAARAKMPKVENVPERRAEIAARQDASRAASRAAADRNAAAAKAAAFLAEAEKRTPEWAKAVIVAELIEDQSDSMSDYFGSRTLRTVILGFAKSTRDMFPDLRRAAATFKETADLATAPDSAEHREKYSMGGGYYLKSGFRHSSGWRVSKSKLYHGAKSVPVGEWAIAETAPAAKAEPVTPAAAKPEPVTPAAAKPEPAPAAAQCGMTIESHTHSKKGFRMFICVLADRIERAEFDRLRDAAAELGGWYSRPWNGTPGGFAFKDRTKAEHFATPAPAPVAETIAETAPTPAAQPVVSVASRPIASSQATKFRTLADKLESEIESKFAPRQSNTPKRQREADSARLDGWHLKRTQSALRALADRHDAGDVPAILATLKSKAEVFALMRSNIDRSLSGYYDAGVDTNTPAIDTPQARALWAMIAGKTPAEEKAEALREKTARLQFAKIPGYFPTPAPIVAQMIEAAGIPEGAAVLEPSAGSGAITDRLPAGVTVSAFEHHCSLREVLTLKGVDLIGSDFMAAEPAPTFDRVLMNPPFENGQDMEHVLHAFRFLKPGGRLVAIVSPGPFFRQDRKASAFREWFDGLGGEKVEIAAGAFKESGTCVATVLIILDS